MASSQKGAKVLAPSNAEDAAMAERKVTLDQAKSLETNANGIRSAIVVSV